MPDNPQNSTPDEPREPRVSVTAILGRANPNLRTGTIATQAEEAMYERRQDPNLVLRAAKARFASYTERRLMTRPDPAAPVYWYDYTGRGRIVPVEDTRTFLLAQWDLAQSYVGYNSRNPSRSTVLDAIMSMSGRVWPFVGLCVVGMHAETGETRAWGQYIPLDTLTGEDAELVTNAVRAIGAVPLEYEEHARRLVGWCYHHRVMHCDNCGIRYDNSSLTPRQILTCLDGGCGRCENREWLNTLRPTRQSPSALKSWLSATRQFVEVL